MKAILFPASYSPVVGGLQMVVQALAKYLQQGEHHIRVVTNRYPVSLPVNEVVDGIEVNRLLFMRPQLDQLRRNRTDLFIASLYHGPSSYRRLKSIFTDFAPDVVNVHFPDGQIPFILKLRQQFKFKLIVSLHGHDVERAFDKGDSHNAGAKLNKSAIGLRAILQEADAVTAVSQYLLSRASVIQPAIENKSCVIYNGIDPARFRDANSHLHPRPYILALGRLTYSKGFDLLLEAFARAGSSRKVDLIIAGDGPERERLRHQVETLGLTNAVHFLGHASEKQVVALMNGCLFVAVPSRSEGFGIVALEAIAAGKLVLATEAGGLQEFLSSLSHQQHENLGSANDSASRPQIILVEPGVEAMAQKLDQIVQPRRNSDKTSSDYLLPDTFTVESSCASYERVFLN